MYKKYLLYLILSLNVALFSSWGFFAHKKINRLAVFILPPGMLKFYKNNIDYITDHAVDPDKRRYTDSSEAVHHYLDADHYGELPFDSLPERWEDAVSKLSSDTLTAYGTLPWHIQKTYYALVRAFSQHDSLQILRLSSDLGHYIADAHVPLHTTENYNGQLSGQTGIHAFWESRLPELFFDKYDLLTGKVHYIADPLKEAWVILRNTFSYKDSVLLIEARLNKSFMPDQKFSFSQRNGKVEKQYSIEYSEAYHKAMNGMVEKQMRASILLVGSYWYSAWIDAGQPKLTALKLVREKDEQTKEENKQQAAEIIGRKED